MSTELNKKTVSLILVGAVSHSLSIVFNVSFSHCVQIKIIFADRTMGSFANMNSGFKKIFIILLFYTLLVRIDKGQQ